MAAAKFFFLSEMIMECLSAVFDLCKININLQQVRALICINHPRDPLCGFLILKASLQIYAKQPL